MTENPGTFVTILLLSALLLLSACGSEQPGLKDEPITQPLDVYDVLQIEAGKGDRRLGKALVLALKVMANEAKPKKVYGKIRFREGSRVLKIARKYLKDGKDEKSKKKIRRLLQKIAPGTIDKDKKTSWHDIQRLIAQVLNKLIPMSRAAGRGRYQWNHSGTMTITYPNSFNRNRRRAIVTAIQQAVNRSLDAYRALGLRSGAITIRLLPRRSSRTAGELINSSRTSCTLNMYPQPGTRADAEYKQMVAHEVFHCFQEWNFRTQSNGRAGLSVEQFTRLQNAVGWWTEGSAEYFSNHVYPCVNSEHQFVAGFDTLSPIRSFLAMEYEAFVFFQHLANTRGNSSIIQLLRSLPNYGGQRSQA